MLEIPVMDWTCAFVFMGMERCRGVSPAGSLGTGLSHAIFLPAVQPRVAFHGGCLINRGVRCDSLQGEPGNITARLGFQG